MGYGLITCGDQISDMHKQREKALLWLTVLGNATYYDGRGIVGGTGWPPLCKPQPGVAQLQRHLLQEDLIEDCLRDQESLTLTVPVKWELLFRIDAFLGPMGCGWMVLKELAHHSDELAVVFLSCSYSQCHWFCTMSPPTPTGKGQPQGSDSGWSMAHATSYMYTVIHNSNKITVMR